jgi:hypothetical protein
MPRDLLWQRRDPKGLTPRPREFIAPTWSWPSLNGPVLPWDVIKRARKVVARVMDIQCTPLHSDSYLQVSSGYLIIEAPAIEAEYLYERDADPQEQHCLKPGGTSPSHPFNADYALEVEDKHHVKNGEKLWLLAIAGDFSNNRDWCLVLKPIDPACDEHWRIGLFHPTAYGLTLTQFEEFEKMFENADRKIMKIV